VGTLDGDVIEGRWDASDDGVAWRLDFDLRYARAAASISR
jgi:hypothetical protein